VPQKDKRSECNPNSDARTSRSTLFTFTNILHTHKVGLMNYIT